MNELICTSPGEKGGVLQATSCLFIAEGLIPCFLLVFDVSQLQTGVFWFSRRPRPLVGTATKLHGYTPVLSYETALIH